MDVPLEAFDDLIQYTPLEATNIASPPNNDAIDDTKHTFAYGEPIPSATGIDELPSYLADGILTPFQAQELLNLFRDSMNQYFPFVVIPREMSIVSMSKQRPFLFLAIMTSACPTHKPLQRALDASFRNILSQRVVFNGEKSLDLLQGLLVYLAWSVGFSSFLPTLPGCFCSLTLLTRYHFHLTPRSRQSYQFLQIAIGMTIDLGLDERPCDTRTQMARSQLSHDGSDEILSSDEFYSRETRRTYLGCYYLSVR